MKKYNENNYLNKLKELFNIDKIKDIKIIINEDPRKTIIQHLCSKHGIVNISWQLFNKYKSNILCQHCRLIEKNKNEFLTWLKNNNYKLISGDYNNSKSRIIIQDVNNKIPINVSRNQLLTNGINCPKRKQDKHRENYFKIFEERANKIHDHLYLYNKSIYKGVMEKIEIICPNHGIFWQTPDAHLRGQRCPKCSMSYRENYIKEFLEEKNILYVYNKGHKELINPKTGYPLKPDFYLPKYNTIIEYDGFQHYKNIYGNKNLKEVQKLDELKNKLCMEKGIKLFRFNINNIDKLPQMDFLFEDESED